MICANRFGWPPTVTRQQTERDLMILAEAAEAKGV